MPGEMTVRICRRGIAARLIPVLCVLTVFGAFLSCTRPDERSDPAEKITLAYSTPPYTVLVDIALKQGYFRQEGLDVTPKQYAYGKLAFDALLKGEADLATVGETPFIFAILKGERLSIIATIQTSNRSTAIVARKDKGILAPADLKNRRIGATFGTVGEFFLDASLVSHGISRKEVKVINLSPEEMGNALAQGEVDAVSTWSPVLGRLQKQFDGNAVLFFDPDIYTQTFNIAARQEYIHENPGKVRKVLAALLKAEVFARQNPAEAQTMIAALSGIDAVSAAAMWADNAFAVTLDQSLLLAMEDESRWAKGRGHSDRTKIPNYLDHIYFDGLASVKPKAVRILR